MKIQLEIMDCRCKHIINRNIQNYIYTYLVMYLQKDM
jgi:hypothetical protein